MRPIDADKIRNKLKQKEINPATIFINEVLIGLLDDAPTVDAVEVVRCKDCAIRFDACPMAVRIGSVIQIFTEDEDFCSRGRKESDGAD